MAYEQSLKNWVGYQLLRDRPHYEIYENRKNMLRNRIPDPSMLCLNRLLHSTFHLLRGEFF